MRRSGVPVVVESVLKVLLLAVVGAGGLWVQRRGLLQRAGPRAKWAVVAFGMLCWTSWGALHTDGGFVHVWDQVHYFVNSKYFSELKYDGLYVATIAAYEERYADYEPPQRVRDVRINRIVDLAQVRTHQQEVRARFSEARWDDFKEDVVYLSLNHRIFLDRGYNAPPPLTATLRILTSWLPVRFSTMRLLAAIDTLCVLGSVLVIAVTYGPGVAALCSLLLGGAFLSRFYWMGGAFARHDWFLALVAGSCGLKRERYAGAGAAFGYAIAVRLFPALFLVPLIAWFARRLQQRRHDAVRFAAGLALTVTVMSVMGLSFGGGAEAYALAWDKLTLHAQFPVGNAVGLRAVLSTTVDGLLGHLTDPVELYEFNRLDAAMIEIGEQRAVWMLIGALAGLAFSLLLGWRARSAADAAALGLVPMALLSSLSCYYWVLLVLLPLLDAQRGTYVGVVANLLMYACGLAALQAHGLGWVTRFNPMLVFVPCGVVLIASLLVWSWPTLHADDLALGVVQK